MTAPTQSWLAEQYHSGRLDVPNAHRYGLSDTEHESLVKSFNILAIETSAGKRLERPTLVHRIQSQLPHGVPPSFADQIYRILAYHGTAPFYPHPEMPLPRSLSLQDVQRGLAWLLPNRHLQMSEMGNLGRMRTAADGRRLLFQSLAVRTIETSTSTEHEAARRRYARRNAFDIEHVARHRGWSREDMYVSDWVGVNRDEDGDEMYHDIVDVLHRNVPDNYPYASSRDHLRPLAKELKADFEFHSLIIIRNELTDIMRALVAMQFKYDQALMEPARISSLDEPIARVMAGFSCDDPELVAAFPVAPDYVAWPAFDLGMKPMEHLFDPVYRVLIEVFLDGNSTISETQIAPLYELPSELQVEHTLAGPHVLSYGWMNLLPAIVPEIIDWECCHTVMRWRRSSGNALPARDNILIHLQPQSLGKDPETWFSTVLFFSGHDQVSGERYRGGAIVATEYELDEGREVWNLYLFRLAPSVCYEKLVNQRLHGGLHDHLILTDAIAPKLSLNIDKMVAELDLSGFVKPQTINIDALEVWNDDGREL